MELFGQMADLKSKCKPRDIFVIIDSLTCISKRNMTSFGSVGQYEALFIHTEVEFLQTLKVLCCF